MPNIGAHSYDAGNCGAFDNVTNRQVIRVAPCAQLQLTIRGFVPVPRACCGTD